MRSAFLILTLSLLTACHNDPPIVGPAQTAKTDIKEHMINANRTIAQSEETAIDEYIGRRGWPMQKLPEGVRIWEYQSGTGPHVEFEDSVCVKYSVEAINGKTIYSEIEENYMAGRRRDMIGLDQAVLTLRYGSHAKLILPSNLAYGIGGDGNRIPQSAILVVDVFVQKPNNK